MYSMLCLYPVFGQVISLVYIISSKLKFNKDTKYFGLVDVQ